MGAASPVSMPTWQDCATQMSPRRAVSDDPEPLEALQCVFLGVWTPDGGPPARVRLAKSRTSD
jgi:hypothetical protein